MKKNMESFLQSQMFSSMAKEEPSLDKAAIVKNRKNIDVNLFQGYDVRGDALAQKPGDRVNLKPSDAYLISLAIGNDFAEKCALKKKKDHRTRVFVGADNRLSSPLLRAALVEGFADAGCAVDYTEEDVPTGAVSRKILISDYDISVQITGSHNPYFNNGFKITSKQNKDGIHDPDGTPSALYGNKRTRPFELIDIYDRIVSEKGPRIIPGGEKRKLQGVVDEYIDDFIKYFKKQLKETKGRFKKSYCAVIDPGNGVGYCAERLFQALGVKTISVFSKSDGSFPNHPADPSKEDGVKFACEFVRSLNKDSALPYIGIVFDGDGDRSGIIGEDGEVIYPEKIVVVNYIRFILENMEALEYLHGIGEHVSLALDVRGSSFMAEMIEKFAIAKKLGIRGEYIPAGYPSHRTFVTNQIARIRRIIDDKKPGKEEKDLLSDLMKTYTSAETSGHFFYATAPDHYPDIVIDDGIFAAAKLLYIVDTLQDFEAREALLRFGKPKKSYLVKELFDVFEWKPVSNEIRDAAPYEDSQKFETIDSFKKTATEIKSGKKQNPFSKAIKDIIDVDGVRIVFEDNSFLLMRASNTSPKFTYKFEGPSRERLAGVIEEFLALLKNLSLSQVGTAEIEKELAAQKKFLSPRGTASASKESIFAFRNISKFLPEEKYRSFLEGSIFKGHVTLVNKNVSADRFGFRSEKSGIFGARAQKEREGIEKWLNARIREGFRGMIHFGIGGQALGNRAQMETMSVKKGFRIKVVEKLGTNISEVFSAVKKSGIASHKILLHASSKSGTTDETLIGFQDALHFLCIELSIYLGYGAVEGEQVFSAFRNYLKKINQKEDKVLFAKAKITDLPLDKKGLTLIKELMRRIIFTTTFSREQSRFFAFAQSPLIKELMSDEPLACFSIPDNVGGRFSELSQSGAITTFFAGRSIRKQFQAGKKIIPLLQSHDPEENTALRLAVYAHLLDPEVIIFAYPSLFMKAEAQQKAQLFPESNGKSGKGSFVLTAIGTQELNKKVKALLRISPQKPPLVIIQNTLQADAAVRPVELSKELSSRTPVFSYTRQNLSEENLAASALFFQEFTVRYGILRTAAYFSEQNVKAENIDFGKKDSPALKTYAATDPQNQPYVELAKKSVSQRAAKMFKNEQSSKKEISDYYGDIEKKVKSGPWVEKIIVSGCPIEDAAGLLDKAVLDKIDKAALETFSEMENDVLRNAVESIISLLPENSDRSFARDRLFAEYQEKTTQIFEDISILGKCPLPQALDSQAKKLAQVLIFAEKEGKIPLPIFYSHSEFAEVLGSFFIWLGGLDFGIGTREQHSYFQSILDGLDKTCTLLFDFCSPYSEVKKRERQIFTFGFAKDYLHNLYPDTVRRLFLEEEANAIASVKRNAAVIRMPGLDGTASLCSAFRFIARGVYLKNAAI
jgi:phosphomannomutase / phosphoglucomutase